MPRRVDSTFASRIEFVARVPNSTESAPPVLRRLAEPVGVPVEAVEVRLDAGVVARAVEVPEIVRELVGRVGVSLEEVGELLVVPRVEPGTQLDHLLVVLRADLVGLRSSEHARSISYPVQRTLVLSAERPARRACQLGIEAQSGLSRPSGTWGEGRLPVTQASSPGERYLESSP
jgi:hypothetical protein